MFSQACVIHSVQLQGGGVVNTKGPGHNIPPPRDQVTTPPWDEVTTPPSHRDQVTTPPPPWDQVTTPPRTRTQHFLPRGQVTTPPPPETVGRRAVRILLECILVLWQGSLSTRHSANRPLNWHASAILQINDTLQLPSMLLSSRDIAIKCQESNL